jgi:hypothetical protein
MNPTTVKYGLIGLALLASHGALAYVVSDYKERGHRAANAEQKAEASNKLAASEKRKSDADNANIIATLELQDAYEKRIKALEDNSDGSGDRIAASVRRIAARCRGGGGNQVPGETPNPISVPSVPGGSREELLKRIGSDFDALGKSADRLKEKFRACFDWAHQHGR